MESHEKDNIVAMLERSRSEVNAAAAGIPAAQEKASPGEGRWSVLDCAEHIAIVEGRFLSWLETAERVETPQISKEKEAQLRERIVNRGQKAEAPDPAKPTGRFPSLAEALEHFNAARTRTIEFAAARSG